MEAALLGASLGALLAFGLLSYSRRRAARQREAELFARRLKTAGAPAGPGADLHAASESA